ncbi:TolC family protein, partial [Acinetobacter baumannii]
EQAVAAYEKAVQTAYGDAEKGLTAVKADERQVALLREATDKSRFAYEAVRKGYDLGIADLTTLIQAEEAWRATRARLNSASTSALVDTIS